MTAPLPPYQPSSPAWMAGYEHAKRQAAALIGVSRDQIASLNGATTVAAVRAAISAMRPSPPRVSPGMEPAPYSAPSPRGECLRVIANNVAVCCGLSPCRHGKPHSAPTTLHARVAAQDSASGGNALCGQPRGNEGGGMTDTSSMTTGEAEAYRRGLAEGFEQAREMAMKRCEAWIRSGSTEGIRAVSECLHDTIRVMEPPA